MLLANQIEIFTGKVEDVKIKKHTERKERYPSY